MKSGDGMEKPFEVLVKDDFFTDYELGWIWKELTLLSRPGVLADPSETGSARTDNAPIKKNLGIFLHDYYCNVEHSPIFQFTRKIFQGITEEFSLLDFANVLVLSTRSSRFLLQYYEDSDHYPPHQDQCLTTVLYWLCKDPESFEGGDLYFPYLDETIKFKNNRMIMFPSWAYHSVTPVKMLKEGENLGRYSVTQFLTF